MYGVTHTSGVFQCRKGAEKHMEKLLYKRIYEAIQGGEDAVLCTILAARGSTPRHAGAKMAVFADGGTVGTIGGGSMEYNVNRAAADVLQQGASRIADFSNSAESECGGNLQVFLQLFQARSAWHGLFLQELLRCLEMRNNSWLAIDIADPREWGAALYDDATQCVFHRITTGNGFYPWLQQHFVRTESGYVEPLSQAGAVYIYGGGHVSQELVPLLSRVGFRVVVSDPRWEISQKALFPTADAVVALEFDALAEQFSLGPADWIVITTRNREDHCLVGRALQTGAAYVGVIGSRRKAERLRGILRKEGVGENILQRLHTPMGLPIGAETPAEIAVSTVAEMIQYRASGLYHLEK